MSNYLKTLDRQQLMDYIVLNSPANLWKYWERWLETYQYWWDVTDRLQWCVLPELDSIAVATRREQLPNPNLYRGWKVQVRKAIVPEDRYRVWAQFVVVDYEKIIREINLAYGYYNRYPGIQTMRLNWCVWKNVQTGEYIGVKEDGRADG